MLQVINMAIMMKLPVLFVVKIIFIQLNQCENKNIHVYKKLLPYELLH